MTPTDTDSPATPESTASEFQREVVSGIRFEFGKNWRNFLSLLTEERIDHAMTSLQRHLGLDRLDGLKFVDAGSGSGLFSLAARRLGATVHSFDFDPSSVGCTQELKRRYFNDDPNWTIQHASVLDQNYVQSLGQFDVVYSWGVLHHTGSMWPAIENVNRLVASNGRLFIALYNDQGWKSKVWLWVKQIYCSSTIGRWAMIAIWVPHFFARMCVTSLLSGTNKFASYHRDRGMSPVHDWIDWIGGLPFEVATCDEITQYHEQRGFKLLKLISTKGLGNNEFVFQRTN